MFHILVVDDDKNTRFLLKTILEAEHFSVYTAVNGEDALEILDHEHIDLVVLDIMMPKMDGFEFTKNLRDIQNNIPILMVSAKQLPRDKHKAFLLGTDDYITKPFDDQELVLRIKALLRRAQIVSERKIVIGDITLDYDNMTVTKGNEVQGLPQKHRTGRWYGNVTRSTGAGIAKRPILPTRKFRPLSLSPSTVFWGNGMKS